MIHLGIIFGTRRRVLTLFGFFLLSLSFAFARKETFPYQEPPDEAFYHAELVPFGPKTAKGYCSSAYAILAGNVLSETTGIIDFQKKELKDVLYPHWGIAYNLFKFQITQVYKGENYAPGQIIDVLDTYTCTNCDKTDSALFYSSPLVLLASRISSSDQTKGKYAKKYQALLAWLQKRGFNPELSVDTFHLLPAGPGIFRAIDTCLDP